jgi:hypothetical protein
VHAGAGLVLLWMMNVVVLLLLLLLLGCKAILLRC